MLGGHFNSKINIMAGLMVSGQLLLNSCVTLHRPTESVSIPVIYQPMFMACAPLDREATLTMANAGVNFFSATMVWSFPTHERADIQFNSPLGDTMFQVSRKGSSWSVLGSEGVSIVENAQGVIEVGGYEIPLKSDEVGCVLTGVWPASWLNTLDAKVSSSAGMELTGSDRLRKIVVNVELANSGGTFHSGDIKSRVMLEWGGIFGFFRRKIMIERLEANGSVTMTISGVKEYRAKWTIVE